MGSDCCHTVTHNVPIQAQHPLSWPRKFKQEKMDTEMTRAREGGGRERVMKIEKVVGEEEEEEEFT